jgi:hypothetical protein
MRKKKKTKCKEKNEMQKKKKKQILQPKKNFGLAKPFSECRP